MITWCVLAAAAFLTGSIPFALLIGLARGVDIRRLGSRNVGASNLGRVLGRRFGVLAFLLDAGKGALPVVVAGIWSGAWGRPVTELGADLWAWLAVAFCGIAGHMFSPWVGFRGGKGVATGFGALAAMWPVLSIPALVALLVWLAVLRLTRYISVASMLAALSLPPAVLAQSLLGADDPVVALRSTVGLLIAMSAVAALVIWKHRGNLTRLRAGTEPQVGGAARPLSQCEQDVQGAPDRAAR